MVFRRKRTFRPKKRTFKRRPRSKSARAGRKMQRMALSFVKKKYTIVEPITMAVNQSVSEITISHIGSKNTTTPANTITLRNADPDQMATGDMKLYQFFKISGVAFKLFWPEGTSAQDTPV